MKYVDDPKIRTALRDLSSSEAVVAALATTLTEGNSRVWLAAGADMVSVQLVRALL